MNALGFLIAAGYCFVLGLAFVRAFSRQDKNMPTELLIGLAFPLGAGLVGCIGYMQSLFAWPIGFWPAVGLGLITSVYLLIRSHGLGPLKRTMPLWLLAIIALLTLLSLYLAIALPYRGGDGIWIHSFKARHLLAEASWLNPIFHDPRIVHCNEYTPLWAANLLAFTAKLGGGWSEPWPNLLLVLMFPALLFIIYGALSEQSNKKAAAFFTLALALTPAYAFRLGGAYSHYLDIPLSAFIAASVILLQRHLQRGAPGSGALAALFAVATLFVKNEGLPIFILLTVYVVAALIFSASVRRISWKPVVLTLLLTCWPIPFHLYFRAQIRTTHYQIWFRDWSAQTMINNVDRIPFIFWDTARELGNPMHWGLWWLLFIAVLLIGVRRWIKSPATIFLAPMLAILGPTFLVYWQDYMDFRQHIQWSFDRLLIQLLPCAVLFLAYYWRERSKRNPC